MKHCEVCEEITWAKPSFSISADIKPHWQGGKDHLRCNHGQVMCECKECEAEVSVPA